MSLSIMQGQRVPDDNKIESQISSRLYLLDTLRGFALINMILYHLAYDLVIIFGVSWPWFHTMGAFYWQQLSWIFIIVSGASIHLSKHKYKSGLKVLGFGLIITFITCVFIPEEAIPFGILTFMGLSILITQQIKPLLDKVNAIVGMVVSFLLFAFVRYLPSEYVGFFNIRFWNLPKFLYSTNFLFGIGLPNKNYPMIDYFPLIPWIFLYWAGFFGFKLLWRSKMNKILTFKIPGLSFIGSHTLLIYMLHQPILFGITYLIFS